MAVLAAADNIDDLSPIVPAIMPVVYKHCATQVNRNTIPLLEKIYYGLLKSDWIDR